MPTKISYRKFIFFVLLNTSQATHSFPDFNWLLDYCYPKTLLATIGIASAWYVNRACWKSSYEFTYNQRDKNEKMYLEMFYKLVEEQTKNVRLEKQIDKLKERLEDLTIQINENKPSFKTKKIRLKSKL